MPVIGLLSARSPATDTPLIAVIRQELNETGFVEGRNVAVDYRWTEGRYDRLAGLRQGLAPNLTRGRWTSVSGADESAGNWKIERSSRVRINYILTCWDLLTGSH